MPYTKTNWTETTPINPTNLNKVETGIETAQDTAVAAEINAKGYADNVSDQALTDAKAYRDLWQYPGTIYIDGGNIYANSVTTNAIANAAITNDKIVSLNADKIVAISLSAISADLGIITAGEMNDVLFKASGTDSFTGLPHRMIIDHDMIEFQDLDAEGINNKGYSVLGGSFLELGDKNFNIGNSVRLSSTQASGNVLYVGDKLTFTSSFGANEVSFSGVTVSGLSSASTETGWMGIGVYALSSYGSGVGSMVGVNFKIQKTYTPSSVSMTTSSVSARGGFRIVDIGNNGFTLILDLTSTTGLYFWRGTYTA